MAAHLSYSLTVDEFLRHWCEQLLLLFTTHYAISPAIEIPDLAKGLPRIVGPHRATLRRLGLELQGRAEPGTRRTVQRNLPLELVLAIEKALDSHQVVSANRTQFIISAAEYGLKVVHLPRDRGMAVPAPRRHNPTSRRD